MIIIIYFCCNIFNNMYVYVNGHKITEVNKPCVNVYGSKTILK